MPAGVVAAHVRGGLGGYAGQRDDRDLPGQPVQLARLEHPVVQDQAVALAGQRQDPAAAPWSFTSTERISRLKPGSWAATSMPRLIMSGNCRLSSSSGEDALADLGRRRPPDDHADDLLQPGAQRPGRAVRGEAELGDGLQDPLPGLLAAGCCGRSGPATPRRSTPRPPGPRRRSSGVRGVPGPLPSAAPGSAAHAWQHQPRATPHWARSPYRRCPPSFSSGRAPGGAFP